jgi:hypothetical protein
MGQMGGIYDEMTAAVDRHSVALKEIAQAQVEATKIITLSLEEEAQIRYEISLGVLTASRENAKAEEASNMGLNMYIWSVRNTIWVLQSLYSAKREELGLLIQQETTGKMLDPTETLNRSKISLMYENLIHNLVLEYVGIRDEIMNRLGNDIESTQRMVVIENLKEFLSDREKLDKQMIATSETNGKKI